MPRKVTAWGCEHGCRRRVLTDRAAMERHEQTCWMNPARRTCKTCWYEWWDVEEGDRETGAPGWSDRCCALDLLGKVENGIQPIAVNCPSWKERGHRERIFTE